MKLNFGHGIMGILLVFMAGISYLVYRCTLQPIGLVNPDYYAQEIKYSDQMTKERNSKALDKQLEIGLRSASRQVLVKYPVLIGDSKISGEILFFKPDNNGYDFTVPVKADANHEQLISIPTLQRGAWRVKINWKANDIS